MDSKKDGDFNQENEEIKQGFNIEEYEKVETEKQRKFYGLNK